MQLLFFLQELRTPFLDFIFLVFTSMGGSIVIFSLLCFIYWCINKKLAYHIFFTYFLSGLIVQGMKITFRIERPWILSSKLSPVSDAVSEATGYSFPSGHTQAATSIYSNIALHYKKKTTYIISSFIIFLVMLSRMYLGCHTLKDVLVAFFISIIVAFIVNYFGLNYTLTNSIRFILTLLILCSSIGLIIYSYYVVNTELSPLTLVMDSFSIGGAGIGFAIAWYIEQKWIKYNPGNTRYISHKIIKFIFGLFIALLIKEGLKLIPLDEAIISTFRYAIFVLWIIAIYPFILKKINF